MIKLNENYVVFQICGNRDSPFHAMTNYCLRLCSQLRTIGVNSWVLSDLDCSAADPSLAEVIAPRVDWATINENDLQRIINTASVYRGLVPIIHLHLSYPNHGCIVRPEFLAHYPNVISVHEHSSKPRHMQMAQLDYFKAACKIITSSEIELDIISQLSDQFNEKVHISLGGREFKLHFSTPPTIIPSNDVRRNPFARDIAWLGMIRNGYDWETLFEIAKKLSQNYPGIFLHIIGTSVDPMKLIELLEGLYVVDLSSYRKDLERLGKNYNFYSTCLLELRSIAEFLTEHGKKKYANIILHLDKANKEISSILLEHCFLGLQHNNDVNIDHSSSISSLMAHGLPVMVRDSCFFKYYNSHDDLLKDALVIIPSKYPKDFILCVIYWVGVLAMENCLLKVKRNKTREYIATRNGFQLARGCKLVYETVIKRIET